MLQKAIDDPKDQRVAMPCLIDTFRPIEVEPNILLQLK